MGYFTDDAYPLGVMVKAVSMALQSNIGTAFSLSEYPSDPLNKL
jgi:hypothetical protein